MDRLTNVCEATSQSLDFDSFRPTHRKGKKLLAEKKRRARINNCLMRIRDIVCNGEEDQETDLDKMEKAEILEKTLEVLTRVRHDFESTRKMSSLSTQKAMAIRYASGFSSCAEESIRYIQSSRLVPTEVKNQLQVHLRSISRRMESTVQEDQQSLSYSHFYPNPPSVVIENPQIVPIPSATTPPHLPSSSSISFVLPEKDNTASLHISSTTDIKNSHIPTEIPPTSQVNCRQSSIPSPIHSSTPIPNKVFHTDNSLSFIPIGTADMYQDYKENKPCEHSANVPVLSQQPIQTGSAFHRITPHYKPGPLETEEHCDRITNNQSPSSSNLYSPVSPVPSPVIVHTSKILSRPSSAPDRQPIYNYYGYEPYPTYRSFDGNSFTMPIVGDSPSDTQFPQTPNKAMNLCIKRVDSHNISPETMWRPW